MASDDSQDLLSAALGDAGLSFLDSTSDTPQVVPQYNPIQLSNNTVPATRVLPSVIAQKLPPHLKNARIIRVSGNFQTGGKSILQAGQSLLSANRPPIVYPAGTNIQAALQQTMNKINAVKNNIKEAADAVTPQEEMAIDDEADGYQAETFVNYKPSKLKFGMPHPDPVVEATSLRSVQPPDVYYRPAIPEEVIDEGRISALQLESVIYASQQHDNFLPDGSRAGFLLGDGAGVGKGRTLAAIIYENFELERKKAIWLSVSNDLKYDAERDLRDIGAKEIQVHALNKFKYGKLYSREIDLSSSSSSKLKKKPLYGVVFGTYSSLIGESSNKSEKYNTRLLQLVKWFGKDFDGVIVFDECHKAKNLCPTGSSKPTKTGKAVLELQRKLPKARIVYASATGASEPKNMAYMVRLGLWGPGTTFSEFLDFSNAVEKRGVGAMELIAVEMKLRGVYLARQLSFEGADFREEKVQLSKKFKKLYDDCVGLWVDAKFRFEKALELMEDDNHIKKAVWGQFWGAHQRFFKYLCIAAKVKTAVNLARDALKSDKCVVIGLQSTGEAKTLEQLEENGGELNDFVSTAKAVFTNLIEKHFPAPNRKKTLKLLGRDTTLLDELGITLNRNGTTKLTPMNKSDMFGSFSNKKVAAKPKKNGQSNVWSLSDSEEEDPAGTRGSDYAPSSDASSEDYESVSEHGSSGSDDIDAMWDTFETKQKQKVKKRKIKRSKKQAPRQPRPKKVRVADKCDSYKDINAAFLSEEAMDLCERLRDELLDKAENLSSTLPPNTLDELIDELGGPDNVAEMTGRKGRVVSSESGSVQYESRTENDVTMDFLNVAEKQRFMDGEKQIAIISEAASSGISLHSDKRARNRKRRVHLTIELPWSADRAIQQFGRSHRSNQVIAPEYVFLISDLAGERRFASTVAKRLESLGALSHGDRKAKTDLKEYNIDSRLGRDALEVVMKSIVGQLPSIVNTPKAWETQEDFFHACRVGLHGVGLVSKVGYYYNLEKDYNSIAKFLNRLLGLEFDLQNALSKYFFDTLDFLKAKEKLEESHVEGIQDLTAEHSHIEIKTHRTFYYKFYNSTVATKLDLYEVAVDTGISWKNAEEKWKGCKLPDEGFYVSNPTNSKQSAIILATSEASKNFSTQFFRLFKPNIGRNKKETSSNLKHKYKKVQVEEAEKLWNTIYDQSLNKCSHEIFYSRCRLKLRPQGCSRGMRQKLHFILAGAVLSCWDDFEKRYPAHFNNKSKINIVRLNTAEGINIIGTSVSPKAVDDLVFFLEHPTPRPPTPSTSIEVKKEKEHK